MKDKVAQVINKMLDNSLIELKRETTPSAETLEMVKIALSYAEVFKSTKTEREVTLSIDGSKLYKGFTESREEKIMPIDLGENSFVDKLAKALGDAVAKSLTTRDTPSVEQ